MLWAPASRTRRLASLLQTSEATNDRFIALVSEQLQPIQHQPGGLNEMVWDESLTFGGVTLVELISLRFA